MQLDVTAEVYMQYQKLAANIHNTNMLSEQLVKPVITKAKKKQRAYIDKKPQTDFINSPKLVKDTRMPSSLYNRDHSIPQKDDYAARNKSVHLPSYYKGGSAINDRRQGTGLKEAAIQIVNTRLIHTAARDRNKNVSPLLTGAKPS